MILRLTLFFIFCSLLGFSQDKKLEEKFEHLAKEIRQSTYYDSSAVFSMGDSAIKIAKKLNSLSKEALIYQYYGNYYFFSRKHELSKSYYTKSKELAKKSGDITLVNTTLIREAFILSDKDNYTAEKQFHDLLAISIERNDGTNIIECHNGLGIIAEARSNLNEALGHYLNALKEAEKINSKYHIAIVLNNIGLIKFYNKQYEESKKDLTMGLKYAEELDEERLAFNLHNNLGLIASEQLDYKAALKHYKNTLAKARNLGFPQGKGVAFLNLSNSYNELGYRDSAILYIDSTIQIFNEIGELQFLPKAYFLKGTIVKDMGDLTSALQMIDKGLDFAILVDSKTDESSGLRFKSTILKELKRYKEALEAFEQFYTIDDSLAEVNNAEKIAELQFIYDIEKKDANIELLKKENALKESRINIIVLSSVFSILLLFTYLNSRHARIRRRQQRTFTQKLISNIDEERSRISRDLHDDIGQSLSIIKSKIGLFKQNKLDNLDGLEDDMGDIINQARQLSHVLHPSYLEKIGLTRSIASLAERIQKGTGIICSYDIDEKVETLNLEVQTQLYRIIQESINNTIKHANATALKIAITTNNGSFLFEYMDNGKGLDESNNIEGIGMHTIRERALKINGKAIFSDNKGKGFKCTIKFEEY